MNRTSYSSGNHSPGNVLLYIQLINLAVILIIAVLGFYLCSYYYNTVRKDFYAENRLYLDNVASAHENELQILKDIATQLDLSENGRFLLDSQPTKSANLKKELYQYRSVNHFFDVMYYYYQKDHYVFNHSTSIEASYFASKAYVLENCPAGEFSGLLSRRGKKPSVIPEGEISGEMYRFYSDGGRGAVYLLPVAPDYDCLLIFFVNSANLDRILSGSGSEERSTFLLFGDMTVARRGSDSIDEADISAILAEGDSQRRVSIGGTPYVFTCVRAGSGFSYVCLQRMSFFTDDLRRHFWGIALLLLLCCVPSGLLIFLVSRRMLKGISSISRILQTGEDDQYRLDQIESGIRSLVERSESMKEDQLSLRKGQFIRNFLRSDYTALEALRRDAAEAGIDVNKGWLMAAVIGSRSEQNEERTFSEIIAYITESRDVDGYGIHLLNTNQRVMVLFGPSPEALYSAYDDILAIGKKHCDEFLVAVSWHHKSLLNGSLAYLEANSAYDNRFLMDNEKVIRFTETSQTADYDSYRDLRSRYMVQLENTIRVGNAKEVEESVRALCDRLRDEHASLFTFRLLYDEILRILMAQWKGEEKDWNQIYNVFTLSRCLNIEDFNRLLTEACHMMLDTKTDARNEQSRLVEEAVRKMQDEYSSPDLNMSLLAEAIGVSPVTLAVEFKNETGISPSDYLATIRLDRAKELLRTTDMLINDISLAVGYEDDHVFIRRFKKYTGKTPGQYRKDAEGA